MSHLVLVLATTAFTFVQAATARAVALRRRVRDQRGQASAEYALVLLGVAGVALLVGAWAVRTDRIGRLLDTVMDAVLSRVR